MFVHMLWAQRSCNLQSAFHAGKTHKDAQHRCSSIRDSNCKKYICADLCSICISLGVSGVTDTLMPK